MHMDEPSLTISGANTMSAARLAPGPALPSLAFIRFTNLLLLKMSQTPPFTLLSPNAPLTFKKKTVYVLDGAAFSLESVTRLSPSLPENYRDSLVQTWIPRPLSSSSLVYFRAP